MAKAIYYLKWTGTGGAPAGGSAYTDQGRAQKHADHCNKNRSWAGRLLGHRWVVGILNLKEGPKNVQNRSSAR